MRIDNNIFWNGREALANWAIPYPQLAELVDVGVVTEQKKHGKIEEYIID